jgi:assimilatory nitrate reductase catalytic subunit
MHWGSEFVSGAGVNALLPRRSCPDSQQPELKHAAVQIERAVLPWRLVAATWCDEQGWFERREALRALFGQRGQTGTIGQASCVPFGREPEGRIGLLFRAAATAPPGTGWMQALETALGLHGAAQLRYDDARAGQSRVLRLGADGTLQAFVLGGEVAAEGWMLNLLQRGDPAAAIGRALLAAGPRPPHAMPPRSPQVCTCHDVSQTSIVHALSSCDGTDEQRLRQLQDQLGCGTSCGSCLPALRTLVRTVAPTRVPPLEQPTAAPATANAVAAAPILP